jgi:putative transposase
VLADTPARIAPSTYYARKTRPPSRRSVTDAETTQVIRRVHEENYGVYGQVKMHAELARMGGVQGRAVARCTVARCTVARLMRAAGLRGITRTLAGPRTTRAKDEADRPADLVNRDFTATGANRVWVADITYVRTFSGWVYAAFILDVFSRRIVGWRLSKRLYTDLVLDALQMAIWARTRDGADLSSLVHHSDRGVQYRALRYTQRLADAEIVASVGSVGDSYEVSRRRESHPPPLLEPCVTVSRYTAPIAEPVGMAPCFQWANSPGWVEAIHARRLRALPFARRNRLYFRTAHFTRNGLIRRSRKWVNSDL